MILFGVAPVEGRNILDELSVVALLMLGISKFIYWNNQRRAHASRSRQAQLTIKELQEGNNPAFSLYLRPFITSDRLRIANSRFRRRYLPSLDRFFGRRLDLETVFAIALERADHPLLAIGETGFISGAPKVVPTDASWQEVFTLLANGATAIVMVPLPRPSTLWELNRLLEDAALLRKTLFVMPMRLRSGVQERLEPFWMEIHDMLVGRGLDFPPLDPRGGLFTLDDGGRVLHQLDSGGFDIDYLEAVLDGLVNYEQIDAIFSTLSSEDRGILFGILDTFLYISPRHGRLQARPVPLHELLAMFPKAQFLGDLIESGVIVTYRMQQGSQPWLESQMHPKVLDWSQLHAHAEQCKLRLCAKGVVIELAADVNRRQAQTLGRFSELALALPSDWSSLNAPASAPSFATSTGSVEGYLRPEERYHVG
jgi:hypothetical protein